MNEGLINAARMACKVETIIAAYTGPAFCEYSERLRSRPAVFGTPAAVARGKKSPGVLRQAWEQQVAVFGMQRGTLSYIKQHEVRK